MGLSGGEFVVNPTRSEMNGSALNLVVVGAASSQVGEWQSMLFARLVRVSSEALCFLFRLSSDAGSGSGERPSAGFLSRGEIRSEIHTADHSDHPTDDKRTESDQTHAGETLHCFC